MEEQRRFVRSNANMDALRSEQDRKRRRRSVMALPGQSAAEAV